MARVEARLLTEIWLDPQFLAQEPTAQWLYMCLISQPDIAYDGVIALREERWAALAAHHDPERLRSDLLALEKARFVVVDRRAQELLVRSFIRRDGVYRQPNLLRAARKHLTLVTSAAIRAALVVELRRIRNIDDAAKSIGVIDEMLSDLHVDEPDDPSPNPNANPSPIPSDTPAPNGSRVPTSISREGKRGVVTDVSTGFPSSPLPLPPPAGNSLALVPRDDPPATTQALIGEWLGHCRKRPPQNVIGQVSKQVKALLAEGIEAADVRAGLVAWHRKSVHPSVLPSIVNEIMNATPAQARASPRASTTDAAVANGAALAEFYREAEA